MGWFILFAILSLIAYIGSNIKEAIGELTSGNSILAKFAFSSLVSSVAAWIIHFFILQQIMLSISKMLIVAFIVLSLMRVIISIFSNK